MAPRVRKRRSVPCRIGEANPPGIFSKAKCVFVSLAGSEYHHANRLQPAAETSTSSQSTRSAVDMASRRADQVEPVYSLLRTCAISTHYALVPLRVPRPLCGVETGKTLQSECSPAATRKPRGGPHHPAGGGQLQDPRQALVRASLGLDLI